MRYNTNLSKIRAQQGISPMRVAKQLQIPKTTYYCYENGERIPRVNDAIRIADKFGVKDLRELWPPNTGNEQF